MVRSLAVVDVEFGEWQFSIHIPYVYDKIICRDPLDRMPMLVPRLVPTFRVT